MKTNFAMSWSIAGVSAVTLTSTAYAGGVGDTVSEQQVVVPDVNVSYDRWDGLYVGGHLGGSRSLTEFTGFNPTGFDEPYSWPDNLAEAQPLFGGVQVGYNFQNNSLVYGVEFDISKYDSGSTEISLEGIDEYAWRQLSGPDLVATLRGRVGYAFNDSTLVYATAGLALGQLANSIQARIPNADEYSWARDDSFMQGTVFGAGFEYAIDDHWSVRGEGLFFNFDDPQEFESEFDYISTTYAYGAATAGSEVTTLRIGVNYSF